MRHDTAAACLHVHHRLQQWHFSWLIECDFVKWITEKKTKKNRYDLLKLNSGSYRSGHRWVARQLSLITLKASGDLKLRFYVPWESNNNVGIYWLFCRAADTTTTTGTYTCTVIHAYISKVHRALQHSSVHGGSGDIIPTWNGRQVNAGAPEAPASTNTLATHKTGSGDRINKHLHRLAASIGLSWMIPEYMHFKRLHSVRPTHNNYY